MYGVEESYFEGFWHLACGEDSVHDKHEFSDDNGGVSQVFCCKVIGAMNELF